MILATSTDIFSSVDLITLQLTGSVHEGDSTQVTLSSLQNLTLDFVSLPYFESILDPICLPSLQTLGLRLVNTQEDVDHFVESQLRNLVPQLHSLCLDIRIIPFAPDYLRTAFDRTLFECYNFSDLDPLPYEIANMSLTHGKVRNASALTRLTTVLRQQPKVHLRSLYLDTSLRPGLAHSPERYGLINVCEKNQVEVIYIEQSEKIVDYFIVEEFSRRQRERKRVGAL